MCIVAIRVLLEAILPALMKDEPAPPILHNKEPIMRAWKREFVP